MLIFIIVFNLLVFYLIYLLGKYTEYKQAKKFLETSINDEQLLDRVYNYFELKLK